MHAGPAKWSTCEQGHRWLLTAGDAVLEQGDPGLSYDTDTWQGGWGFIPKLDVIEEHV